MKREVICLNNQIIWQGPVQKIPEELKIRGFSGDGYVTVFCTGDVASMRSPAKMTKEQQRPLNEIILKMWEKLSEEERRNLLMEEMLLTET